MARNRKSQSAAIRFGPAIKALVICLMIGGSGIGYVWQKEQILHLGADIKAREKKLYTLESQNDTSRKLLGNLRSPGWLEARVIFLKQGLAPHQSAQIWYLPEPLADMPGSNSTAAANEYALHSSDARARN